MTNMREDALSDDARAVLAIVREEAKAGRLTAAQEALLNRAVALSESFGIIGNFIIKFASFLAAGALIWNYWPKK